MDNKFKRRIGFLREDERKQEEARMRIASHISKCNAFADELYQALLIYSPEEADEVIRIIRTLLYGDIKNG